MRNILLIIVDCLRYDYVTEERMPFLWQFGYEGTFFTNYWSSSHCTDPAITHMLSGYHPDALRLYSMMYEHKDYTIPEDVIMLPQLALKHGYDTGFVTNIGRWYKRGVNKFVDCRFWPGERIFAEGARLVQSMTEPWLLIIHTDDCHTNYTGGSYDAACRAVDGYVKGMLDYVNLDDTLIIITADHGEGLGEKGIIQHGHGLWDFLTHVPLIARWPNGLIGESDMLLDPGALYWAMWRAVKGGVTFFVPVDYVFQAGDTPPNVRHRGVVYDDGTQFIRATRGNKIVTRLHVLGSETREASIRESERLLLDHCASYGIDFLGEAMDTVVEERLRSLGYFD